MIFQDSTNSETIRKHSERYREDQQGPCARFTRTPGDATRVALLKGTLMKRTQVTICCTHCPFPTYKVFAWFTSTLRSMLAGHAGTEGFVSDSARVANTHALLWVFHEIPPSDFTLSEVPASHRRRNSSTSTARVRHRPGTRVPIALANIQGKVSKFVRDCSNKEHFPFPSSSLRECGTVPQAMGVQREDTSFDHTLRCMPILSFRDLGQCLIP